MRTPPPEGRADSSGGCSAEAMGNYVSEQLALFLQSIALGAVLGLIYDLLGVLRSLGGRLWGGVLDALFCLTAACAVFLFVMAGDGEMRLFVPAGALGGAVLALYLAVLPYVSGPALDLLERLLGTRLGESVRNAIYYYVVFALVVIVFWGYLGRTTRAFLDRPGGVLASAGLGLVAFYGLNEICGRLLGLVLEGQVNLNDEAIVGRMVDAPRTTILIVVVLAPVVAGLLIIYFCIRRSAADEMDQKKWNNRIVVAIVSCIGAVLGSATLNIIIGYYQ